jgi:lysophospholipase L1-like esterase
MTLPGTARERPEARQETAESAGSVPAKPPGRAKRGTGMWRNWYVLVITVFVSLGLAELVVRWFVPVRDVGPPFSAYDAVFGKRMKAGFSAERIAPEFRMRLSTNSLGFRGPEPSRSLPGPILFLGDSFTLGYGVNDGEEFPARVAAELVRRMGSAAPAVVNAGIGDSGNGFWVKFLRREAPALQPRLVVMQLFSNDFSDNVNEKLFELEPGGALRELPVPPPSPLRRLEVTIDSVPGLWHSYLVGLLRQAIAPPPALNLPPGAELPGTRRLEPTDQLTLRIVEQAISLCAERGWKMLGLVAALPPAREAAVKGIFERHGVPVALIPAKGAKPELYYRIDGHWHAGGHAFVASRVLEALAALGIDNP